MDIRSALTDHYLAHYFDSGTLGRGRGYLRHVDRVHVEHESDSVLIARALVQGTAQVVREEHPPDFREATEAPEVAFMGISAEDGQALFEE